MRCINSEYQQGWGNNPWAGWATSWAGS